MRRAADNVEVDDFDYLFKIVLIGDAGVGKSALVHRFRYNTFVDQQASTIGVDFIIRSVTIEGKKIKVCFECRLFSPSANLKGILLHILSCGDRPYTEGCKHM